jgi:GTPase SAR1 family protein
LPKEYKLKLVIGGAKGSGKTSFISGDNKDDTPIGVSFESVECYANQGDLFKFVVWDLKDSQRFEFLFPLFCRGACAGLLCFDVNDQKSFIDLKRWIKLLRDVVIDIPIVLIGTKADLGKIKVSKKEINELIISENLEGVFFVSRFNVSEKREEIFKQIVQNIDKDYYIYDFFIPNYVDNQEFKTLEHLFDHCPICKKKNHGTGELRNIFFNKNNPITIKFRESLLRLIDNIDILNIAYPYKMSFGIPCCECYKKIFNKNTRDLINNS